MNERLADGAEVLFRQIHPNFYEQGEPSSQAFNPTDKDDHKLSVDRSARATAAGSFALYTGNGFKSVAVYGVSVDEFTQESIACFSDPLPKVGVFAENPAHSYADYSAHRSASRKNIAKLLKRKAIARGSLHP
jgi:hypothetical protein